MRKTLIYLFILLLPFFSYAQRNTWRIGVNPFSVFEPQATVGACAEYFISNKWSIWAEPGLIFKGAYLNPGRTNLTGYRIILQPRYYMGDSKSFFIAPEMRWKHFSYDNTGTFINHNNADILFSVSHRAVQNIVAGAFVTGGQVYLKKARLMIEIMAGIGVRQRIINRKSLPEGYEYYIQKGGFGLAPHYEWNNDAAPYIPIGIRLVWNISKKD